MTLSQVLELYVITQGSKKYVVVYVVTFWVGGGIIRKRENQKSQTQKPNGEHVKIGENVREKRRFRIKKAV